MKPDQYFRWLRRRLNKAAEEAFSEQIQGTTKTIRQAIPARRNKTRTAVRREVVKANKGLRARIFLDFRQRYRSQGTKTERLFRRAWRRVRPTFTSQLNRKLHKRIGEI